MSETEDQVYTAGAGMRVALELVDRAGEREAMAFDIVADQLADVRNGFLGEGTPIARAILNQTAGSRVAYQVDELVAIHLLAVSPSERTPSKEVAHQREETLRKAVADSDRKSALIFASSFSGKWGDYDPAGIEKWDGEVTPDEPAKED